MITTSDLKPALWGAGFVADRLDNALALAGRSTAGIAEAVEFVKES